LNCDGGDFSDKGSNEKIAKVLEIRMQAVDRVKNKFVEEGYEADVVPFWFTLFAD
jgi:hypothetical protein